MLRDGVVYAGTNSAGRGDRGTFYAVAAESGEERWTIRMGEISLFEPAVTEETVYAAEVDTLYAIDRDSGDVAWEHGFDRTVHHPVVDGDRLYITGHDGTRSTLSALTVA